MVGKLTQRKDINGYILSSQSFLYILFQMSVNSLPISVYVIACLEELKSQGEVLCV